MERAPAHLASPESPGAIFARFLKFGLPRLGWAGGADRDDQARVRRRGRMDFRGELQETARRLPGPSRPRGARALRLLRAAARRQARRLPRRPRLHAAGLHPHARPLGPLRRGQPGGAPGRPLLRADRGGRGAGRPRRGPAQQVVHLRCAAGGHRGRRLRPHALGRDHLRPDPARRRHRLRALDERAALDPSGPQLRDHARWRCSRSPPGRSRSR